MKVKLLKKLGGEAHKLIGMSMYRGAFFVGYRKDVSRCDIRYKKETAYDLLVQKRWDYIKEEVQKMKDEKANKFIERL